MATIITMPRLSDTMEEGVVAKWLKKVGDTVKEGEILAEIETDKATMEFESFYSGTLLHIGLQEGQTAPVDSLLAIVGTSGEDISALLNGGASAQLQVAEVAKTEEVVSEFVPASVPSGVEVVTMPRLSDTMTEGTVASWRKKVGDAVKEGDILAEIETDKATMEFESFYSGTLLHIGIEAGGSAPIDSLLAIIGPAGTDVSAIIASGGEGATTTPTVPTAVSVTAVETIKEVAPVSVSTNERIFASPLAKKIASDKGINLAEVKGTGENGRITKKDIEGFTPSIASAKTETKTVAPIASFVQGIEATTEVKNSSMRKTIAKRLSESKFTAPHYYLTVKFDMDNAISTRTQINNLPDTKVSFNDMVIKATAMALKKHPQVNTTWKTDAMIYNQHIHIGVAVAVEDGLVVPTVKFADTLSLSQIGSMVKELAGKARNKKLTPVEMEGSTFTISNLGMFGIEEFTSIINQPNSAILSVGSIIEEPVVRNGQIVVGHTMKVTLAADHRTIDGATGAQFLQTLKTYVENPVTMLA